MGYSTKRSRKVENRKLALFIENMNYESIDEFGYDVVLGFKQNAFKHKWDVDIIPVTPQLQAEEKYDTYILKNGYCGAFLVGFALHDEWMQQLKNTTMPTVLFDNYIENNPNVAYVGTDSYEGIDMAVKHLHNLGHKKIAFINGSLFSLVSDQRQEAFENSMRNAGLEIYPELMGHGYYIPETSRFIESRKMDGAADLYRINFAEAPTYSYSIPVNAANNYFNRAAAPEAIAKWNTAGNDVAYCFENTFDVAHMKDYQTTRVIV